VQGNFPKDSRAIDRIESVAKVDFQHHSVCAVSQLIHNAANSVRDSLGTSRNSNAHLEGREIGPSPPFHLLATALGH
jgi:hypothetical protein